MWIISYKQGTSWATLYTGIYDADRNSSWAVQGYLWPDQCDQRIHQHVGNMYGRVDLLKIIIGGIMDLSYFLLFESISQSLLYFWRCALYIMCICIVSLFSVISKSFSQGLLDLFIIKTFLKGLTMSCNKSLFKLQETI